ncbi:ISKra4 family transposase [uncultured Paludibaculum sp.]|uniref:ISKra4 family transposase n=1 Tax=uncultured Paludibaculum sp. TaxID=1765020 RepID=UPI002AAACC4E|nr:ISKra4 family transposase [uncultured Paludibaculum sp.]
MTDLEAIEMAVRGAMHRAGAAALGQLLSMDSAPAPRAICGCGGQARFHSLRRRGLLSVLGPMEFSRAYYVCPHCHQGQSPRDRELDVEGTEFSPGVRRMMAAVGSETSFEQGREQLELLAGLEVTAKAVERQAEAIGAAIEAGEQKEIRQAKQLDLPEVCAPAVPVFYIEMDGTGVPVTVKERAGRAGKKEGEPARTREVKLGCVFTQTTTDEDGRPIRDPDSTSYVAAIETAEEFGLRLYTEAWRRGWSRARQRVVLGDGAVWIWNLAEQHFPGAIQIVDLYHARQHIWELAAKLFPNDERTRTRWAALCVDRLDAGKIEALVKILRQLRPDSDKLAQDVDNDADYFERNAERMRYPKFRAQGLFVGSGVVEAGCRTVVGKRLKCSGMFWTVRGANAILALRCCRLSSRFEDYWESRSRAA